MSSTRRIIASAYAIGLAFGPEAGESFAQGWPGWTKYAEPDWWEHSYENPLALPILGMDASPNLTVRVRIQDGPVLWESSAQ